MYNTGNLTEGRYGIRSIKITCAFQEVGEADYIALIGGAYDLVGSPSGVVEVFDIATGLVMETETLQQPRDRFVAVWDPVAERIFVMGGHQSKEGACVADSEFIEVTTAAQGVCQTMTPTPLPTMMPTTMEPSMMPTMMPSDVPSANAVVQPSKAPTHKPVECACTWCCAVCRCCGCVLDFSDHVDRAGGDWVDGVPVHDPAAAGGVCDDHRVLRVVRAARRRGELWRGGGIEPQGDVSCEYCSCVGGG